MASKDIISRTLDAGRGVGQRSQDRIEGIVGQLQRMSEEQLDQVVALLGELRDRSVLSGEQAASAVDRRVREQLSSLGLATKVDVDRRLEWGRRKLTLPPGPPAVSLRRPRHRRAHVVRKWPHRERGRHRRGRHRRGRRRGPPARARRRRVEPNGAQKKGLPHRGQPLSVAMLPVLARPAESECL